MYKASEGNCFLWNIKDIDKKHGNPTYEKYKGKPVLITAGFIKSMFKPNAQMVSNIICLTLSSNFKYWFTHMNFPILAE